MGTESRSGRVRIVDAHGDFPDPATRFQGLDNAPDHRLAAILYFGEGLSLNEIAAVTDVPVGTAKSRIFHARQHLKSRLKGET